MRNRFIAILIAAGLLLALTACHKTENVEVTTTAAVVTELPDEETTAAEDTTKDSEQTSKTASTTVVKNQISLTGTWNDRVSQRATMEVRGGKDQSYQIHIHWGSTAFETDDWTMTGTFNDSTGELTYKNCTHKTITLSEEDGPETEEVHYTGGTGKFLYSNGELRWHADNDPDVNDCVFVR